ncbi:MAG TPA: MCE family protein [Mycobacterium sp.]|uniref:MCE family protein n=1 Tax=Mycobacterium sp. TaxID=1785 RepID=UPI002F40494A
MKLFSERNPMIIGAIGLVAVFVVVLAALQWQKLPFLNPGRNVSAYFADAGGLRTGNGVEISGFPVGKVSSIELDGSGVLVKFKVSKNVHLGDRTEAAIKTKGLLGSKVLDVTPRGDGRLEGIIPMDRTVSPYQLPDALGDLATTISGLNTEQLSGSLTTLAQTFAHTPPDLRNALEGVARFAQTLDERDAHLRSLLDNAAKATGVLAKRTDQVVSLVKDTNALLAQLRTQSAALDQIWTNVSAASRQLQGFIAENRQELRPALDKLNGVLTIIDNRKERLQKVIPMVNAYVMSLGESVASGPFFKAYVVNLLPGQFVQPFINAAFSDLGLDPATLLPSQLTDPPTGQPGTPPLPMPSPRTGQGGQPRQNLPDAITGNPDNHQCGVPGVALPGPGCYPYRQPPPAPPAGGPPPGPPLVPIPAPTPTPVIVNDPATRPGGQP